MNADGESEFREFVAHRSTELLKVAVLLSAGDRHAAEDLLQNALMKVAGRWHRVEDPEAYVRQVLYRQQVSIWRVRGRRRELTVAAPPEGRSADGSGAAELRVLVRQALSRLTPRQRTMLALRYFEDLPEKEVARLLGCSVGTVRSTTHRSLAKLRRLSPELFTSETGPGRPRPELSSVEVQP